MKFIKRLAYYDYYVNGFMVNDRVEEYLGEIHKRPEYLMTLSDCFPEVRSVASEWENRATAYRGDFFVYIDQIHRFSFDLDNLKDPPYDDWLDLDDDMKIYRWMIAHAIDRAYDELKSEQNLYVKDEKHIPPEQIVLCNKLHM